MQSLPFRVPAEAGWHLLFETLAYATGFALFRLQRRRSDILEAPTRWSLVVAAILGAVLGSKMLHHLANPSRWPEYAAHPWLLLGGKTIVGALLGGWAVVEVAKLWLGIKVRTGDVYVLPLLVGMAVGRIGCFLAGLTDGTYGSPTQLPWGVDFGDGIARHPTQIYEILFLALLAAWLYRPSLAGVALPTGLRFRAFILGYLAFRLAIDQLKPYDEILGLNPIQWSCLLVLTLCARDLPAIVRTFGFRRPVAGHPAPR